MNLSILRDSDYNWTHTAPCRLALRLQEGLAGCHHLLRQKLFLPPTLSQQKSQNYPEALLRSSINVWSVLRSIRNVSLGKKNGQLRSTFSCTMRGKLIWCKYQSILMAVILLSRLHGRFFCPSCVCVQWVRLWRQILLVCISKILPSEHASHARLWLKRLTNYADMVTATKFLRRSTQQLVLIFRSKLADLEVSRGSSCSANYRRSWGCKFGDGLRMYIVSLANTVLVFQALKSKYARLSQL